MGTSKTDHFQGKDAYEHILQKKSEQASEIHGEELPGHTGAFLDACRDVCILLILISVFSFAFPVSKLQTLLLLIVAGIIWTIWKTIRSCWFGWSLLERLHRILGEERYEIENHREQEREELTALYASKGLQGELLHEVIQVLMADDERLLKVMMEEEMGLNLEHYEHPLKIGLGAALGSIACSFLMILAYWFFSIWGLVSVAIVIKSISGMAMAKLQKNDLLSALVWNFGAAVVVVATSYFLTNWIQTLL